MPQDQGPTQEPRVSNVEQATWAHNRADLADRTEGLDEDVKIAINNAGFDLEALIRKWKGRRDSWSELRGKKVLDLASGSAAGKPNWHPYFARLCVFNGAEVTVVDKLPQIGNDTKLFHGITVDLVPPVMNGKLAEVVGQGEYDIVHSYSFIGINPSPELTEQLRMLHMNEQDFRDVFLRQAFGLLVEGGIMYLDERDFIANKDIYYTKKDGNLVRL